ncbi:hypothetical protein DL769_004215 [Monosporascus sp. CRB-8-3]|nr:hypothetical protein DL769_004215 [Monosporascus sp. CRB-8-3]
MAPDLNSLPPSSPSGRPRAMNSSSSNGDALTTESPPPRSPRGSISLQAAATMNAGLQHEPQRRSSSSSLSRSRQSPQTGRRRSSVLMNLQLNDPTLPGPGEMVAEERLNRMVHSPQPMAASPRSPFLPGGDPHHNRTPSLGELHQELEAEQEAQVNRLLQQIRQQQLELQRLQAAQGHGQTAVAPDEPTPSSERSSYPATPQPFPPPVTSAPRSPAVSHPRSSFDMAREALHRRSRTPSRGATSPRLRRASLGGDNGEPTGLPGRDESAFYQAETQSLIRENQMLRHRIRELERQLAETHATSSLTREPTQPSHLLHSTSATDDEAAGASTAATTSSTSRSAPVSDTVKGE